MAQVIDRVESSRDLYPWDKWTDGQAWRAVEGEDFKAARAFRTSLYTHARRFNLTVTAAIKRSPTETAVEFQFSKPKRRKS